MLARHRWRGLARSGRAAARHDEGRLLLLLVRHELLLVLWWRRWWRCGVVEGLLLVLGGRRAVLR